MMDIHGCCFTILVLFSLNLGAFGQTTEDCCLNELCPYYCTRCDGIAQCFDLSDELGCSAEGDKKLQSHFKPPIFVPFVLKTLKAQILKEKQSVASLYPHRQCLQRPTTTTTTARPLSESKSVYQTGKETKTNVWSLLLKKLDSFTTTDRPTTTTTEQPIWLKLLNKLKAEQLGITTPPTTTPSPTTENPALLFLLKSLLDSVTENISTTQTPPIETKPSAPTITQPPTTVKALWESATEKPVPVPITEGFKSVTDKIVIVKQTESQPTTTQGEYNYTSTVSSDLVDASDHTSMQTTTAAASLNNETSTSIDGRRLQAVTTTQPDLQTQANTQGLFDITTEAVPNITEWIEALYRAGNETTTTTMQPPTTTLPVRPYILQPADAQNENSSVVADTVDQSTAPSAIVKQGLIDTQHLSSNLGIGNKVKLNLNDIADNKSGNNTFSEKRLDTFRNLTGVEVTNNTSTSFQRNSTTTVSQSLPTVSSTYSDVHSSQNITETVTEYSIDSADSTTTMNYLRSDLTFNTTENVTGVPIVLNEDGTGQLFNLNASYIDSNATLENTTGYPIKLEDFLISRSYGDNAFQSEGNFTLFAAENVTQVMAKRVFNDTYPLMNVKNSSVNNTDLTQPVNTTIYSNETYGGLPYVLSARSSSDNDSVQLWNPTENTTILGNFTEETLLKGINGTYIAINSTLSPYSTNKTAKIDNIINEQNNTRNGVEEKQQRAYNSPYTTREHTFVLNETSTSHFGNESAIQRNRAIGVDSQSIGIKYFGTNSSNTQTDKNSISSQRTSFSSNETLPSLESSRSSTEHTTINYDSSNVTKEMSDAVLKTTLRDALSVPTTNKTIEYSLVADKHNTTLGPAASEINTVSPIVNETSTESEYAILLKEVRKTLTATKERIARIADQLKSINASKQLGFTSTGGLSNKTEASNTNMFKYGLLTDFQTDDIYYNLSVDGSVGTKPILQEARDANTVTTSITRQKIGAYTVKPPIVTPAPWSFQTTTFPFDNFWDPITTQPLFTDSIWNPTPPNTIWSSFFDNWNFGSMGLQSTAKPQPFYRGGLFVTGSPRTMTTPSPIPFTTEPSVPTVIDKEQIPIVSAQGQTGNTLKNLLAPNGGVSISTERSEGLLPYQTSLNEVARKIEPFSVTPNVTVNDVTNPSGSGIRNIPTPDNGLITKTHQHVDLSPGVTIYENDASIINISGSSLEYQQQNGSFLNTAAHVGDSNATSFDEVLRNTNNYAGNAIPDLAFMDQPLLNATFLSNNETQYNQINTTIPYVSTNVNTTTPILSPTTEDVTAAREQHGRVNSNKMSHGNGVPISIARWGSLLATRPSYNNSPLPTRPSTPTGSALQPQSPHFGNMIPDMVPQLGNGFKITNPTTTSLNDPVTSSTPGTTDQYNGTTGASSPSDDVTARVQEFATLKLNIETLSDITTSVTDNPVTMTSNFKAFTEGASMDTSRSENTTQALSIQSREMQSTLPSRYGDLQTATVPQSRDFTTTVPQSRDFTTTVSSQFGKARSTKSSQSGVNSQTTASSLPEEVTQTISVLRENGTSREPSQYEYVNATTTSQMKDTLSSSSTQMKDVSNKVAKITIPLTSEEIKSTMSSQSVKVRARISVLFKEDLSTEGYTRSTTSNTIMTSTAAPDSKEVTTGDSNDDLYTGEITQTRLLKKQSIPQTTQRPSSFVLTNIFAQPDGDTRAPAETKPGKRPSDHDKHDWFDRAFKPTTWYPFETQYATNTPIPWTSIHREKLTRTVGEAVPTTTVPNDNGCLLLQDASEFCKELQSGQYKNPDNCSSYFVCDWGDLYRCFCPPNTLFDSKLRVCNWDYAVEC